MSDDAKPEHPAPWAWVPEFSGLLRLKSAGGDTVLVIAQTAGEFGCRVPSAVLELIRAAPEMERLLWESPQEEPPGAWADKVQALLATLDAARKAPR